jgi:hypothetical protein
MEKEIIETVLTEVLEEQKQGNLLADKHAQQLADQLLILKSINEKLEIRDEELKNFFVAKMEASSLRVNTHPQPVRREFRILLFPEHGATSYYKIVFGRILFWLVMLCLAKYAYQLGERWLASEYGNHKYQKAWETLYRHQSKANQKIMLEVWKDQ